MNRRDIEPGDLVTVSLGDNSGQYVITEIKIPVIYIHPAGNPAVRNGLISINGSWKVQGQEHLNYQINFMPKPSITTTPSLLPIAAPALTSIQPPRSLEPIIEPKPVEPMAAAAAAASSSISTSSSGLNRLDLFRTPAGRFQYARPINNELDKINAPDGYQCIDKRSGPDDLLDHLHIVKEIGSGSFGTVYSACTPLSNPGSCVPDPYVFAVKTALNVKTRVRAQIQNRFKSQPWHETYLLEQLKPLILEQGRGQAFPIQYRNYRCLDGCRQTVPGKKGLASCIINLMELAEGDLNNWAKVIGSSGSSEDYDNALFQLMAGLAALQDANVQVFHNDIKKENILWYRVRPGGVWEYTIGNTTYYLPNRGYVLVISDYGVSLSYGPHVKFQSKPLLAKRLLDRKGIRGIIRDEQGGISYPLKVNTTTLNKANFKNVSNILFILPHQEIPMEVKSKLGSVGSDDNIYYNPRRPVVRLGVIDYYGDLGRGVSCFQYDTFTSREREIIGNNNVCSLDFVNQTNIYPVIEYIYDTQDGVRLFTGGKRMRQPENHITMANAPPDWIRHLETYISGDQYAVPSEVSLFNRKMFAQDFITDYFRGKYSSGNGEDILAKFRCSLAP